MRNMYPDLYAVADEIREGLKDTSSSTGEKTKPSGLMQKKNTEKQSNG